MIDEKKHILILPKWYPNPSDLQLGVFVQNQAELMAGKFKITVLYVKGIPVCPEPFLTKVVKYNGIVEIRIYYQQKKRWLKFLNIIKYKQAQKIGLALIKDPIDLVHVHVPIRPYFLARRLLKTNSTPFLVTEHWSGHLNNQFSKKSSLYKYFYKTVLEQASAITAVSMPLASQLSKTSQKQVQVIPNYIASSNKRFVKTTSSLIQIISVSDFNNHTKNITGLIEGFSLAILENKNLRLTLVGDGPDKDVIVDTIINLSLQDSVKLLGRKEQTKVLEILPSYDFYVCNSNVETFGMTVAEAILAGLPAICTKCGGPEDFVNEKNGILIPTKDSVALKEAMLKMARNYSDFDSEKNKNTINNLFGKTAIQSQWKKLYNSILTE